MQALRTALVTSLGLGLLRPAPGTWGSLPPPLLLGVLWLAGAPHSAMLGATLGLALAASAATVLLGRWSEQRFGRKDPSQVVSDETAGQSLALLAPPLAWIGAPGDPGAPLRMAAYGATAFLLFRLFDIVKPAPAHRLQSLPHGWGILIDDLLAGLYALAVVQVVWRAMV